jgi:hypothetical protein
MITTKPIVKYYGWWHCSKPFTIPTGHKLIPASNLPENELDYLGNPIGKRYWLLNIPKSERHNMELESWHRNYGILIYESDLT